MNHAGHALAILASGTLHVLIFVSLPELPPSGERSPSRVMDFELHLFPTPPPALQAPQLPVPVAFSPTVAVATSAARVARKSVPATHPVQSQEPVSLPTSATEPAAPAPSAAPGPRAPVDLSALAVARAMVDVQALPAAKESPSQAAQQAERALERRLATDLPELSRGYRESGQERLDNTAKDAISFIQRPWESALQPLRRGRYRYRGQGFDAIVLADGRVVYRQKTGASLSVVQTVASTWFAPSALPAIAFHQLIAKLQGKDPAAAERDRFLKRTRPLRELLVERARRFQMELADGRLERRLRHLLALHSERERKHDAVFAAWEECADDQLGELGRVGIETLLRELCPPSSECAFRPQDLARLNARRGQRTHFAPYETPREDGGMDHIDALADQAPPLAPTVSSVPDPASPPTSR